MNFIEKKIFEYLKNFKNKDFVLGFSGGNDSSCLLFILKNLKLKITPVFVKTELTEDSLHLARKNANLIGFNLEIIDLKVFENKEIRFNSKMRCYYCKRLMYGNIKERFKEKIILDGTNYTDTFSYRPGIKALLELGIISPFMEGKIEKKEILNFLESNLPELISEPQSCIATKYPYNTDLLGLKNEKRKNKRNT